MDAANLILDEVEGAYLDVLTNGVTKKKEREEVRRAFALLIATENANSGSDVVHLARDIEGYLKGEPPAAVRQLFGPSKPRSVEQ